MTHPTQAGIGLIRMGESSFVPANLEDDVRGKDVYDAGGQRIGRVEDLCIDRNEREVRFLEVGAGGFLGIGQKRFLVPVEAVVEVAEDWVAIQLDRTEKAEGPAPFDTKVAPPPVAEDRRAEDYASPRTAAGKPPVVGATPTRRSLSTTGRSNSCAMARARANPGDALARPVRHRPPKGTSGAGRAP